MADNESLKNEFSLLVEIMTKLRAENGCPWDRQQTYESLRQYLLEETYEVLELIDQKRYDDLKFELGDLLLQVIFQSQIAEEENRFSIIDVLKNINEKLIYRHPNVFGDVQINSAEEQTVNWERLKKKKDRGRSTIAGVPKTLPALLRAHRIQAKAATVGFDWEKTDQVWDKVGEEIKELKEAVAENRQNEIEEEFGDLLFALVNLSRFLRVNPEDALRQATEKFSYRFQQVESEAERQHRSLDEMTLDEMDQIWDDVKKNNRRDE
ncbi:MAG: nucleoside triphosphate pyrophosphohydrolase [Calditrichaeota bacterium]|nr:nucleoside triphosphate pyrophosphohydrolase [Calditrichota bacterium]